MTHTISPTTASSTALLAVDDLAIHVGGRALLQGISFRLHAGEALSLVGDAVQASRLLGFGRAYVLRRHLLPALAPTLGTLLAFTTAQAVLALAALGFVGVGAQAPTAELGLMITEAMPYYEEAPWLIAAPTAVLLWLVAAMMLIQPEREAA